MLCKDTHCAGHVSANTRPHQLWWGDQEHVSANFKFLQTIKCLICVQYYLEYYVGCLLKYQPPLDAHPVPRIGNQFVDATSKSVVVVKSYVYVGCLYRDVCECLLKSQCPLLRVGVGRTVINNCR